MITRGLGTNRILTRGFGPRVLAASWVEVVRFALYLRRSVSFSLER